MASYNLFELQAMSAPEDNYGYRARAAKEGRDGNAAPDRNDCGACPAHPETLVYNAADAIWVCAECDLAINEAERIAAEELAALFEANEPECNCTQTDVDIFDARGCEFHDSRSEWNTRMRAVTLGQRYETYMQEVA